jgi:hypothetical protein
MLQTNVPAPAQFNSPYVLKAKTLLWAQMLRIKNLPAELEHGAYTGGDRLGEIFTSIGLVSSTFMNICFVEVC